MSNLRLDRLAFRLLLIFIFVIPWENTITFDGVGAIGRIVGSLTLLVGALSIFTREGIKLRRPSAFLLLFALFVVWSIASYYWSINPSETLRRSSTLLQLLGMLWLIWQLCVTTQRRNLLLQAYVLGGFISIISTVVSFNTLTPEDYQRYAALGFDANDLGATLALGIPLAWHLARASEKRIIYLINLLYVPASLVAIVLSSSRSAILVSIVGLFIIPITLSKMGKAQNIGLVTTLTLGTCSLFYFGPGFLAILQPNIERLATISTELSQGDLNGRTVIWRAGLQAFADRPVAGAGLNSFPYAAEPYLGQLKVAHNSFLSILVDTGIIGFVLFAAAFSLVLFPLFKLEPTSRNFTVLLSIALIIAMFPLSWEYRKPVWFILSVLTTYRAFVFGSLKPPASSFSRMRYRE